MSIQAQTGLYHGVEDYERIVSCHREGKQWKWRKALCQASVFGSQVLESKSNFQQQLCFSEFSIVPWTQQLPLTYQLCEQVGKMKGYHEVQKRRNSTTARQWLSRETSLFQRVGKMFFGDWLCMHRQRKNTLGEKPSEEKKAYKR